MGGSRVGVSIFTTVPTVPGTQLVLSRGLLDEHGLVQSNAVLLVMIYFLERSYLVVIVLFLKKNVLLIGHDEHGMWDLSSPNRDRTWVLWIGR